MDTPEHRELMEDPGMPEIIEALISGEPVEIELDLPAPRNAA